MANPKVGQSATLNGKKVVWSGQNYGWQSPATHNKLAKDGKFKGGTQALDRLTSSAKNFVKDKLPGVANAATNYKNWTDESARRVAARDAKTTVGKGINAVKAVTNAPARAKDAAVQAVSNKTNLDPRIVRAGAEVVGALAKTKAGQGIAKASGGRIAPPTNRSVGAAARSDVAGRTAPATRRLSTPNRAGVVKPSSSRTQATRASSSPGIAQRTTADRARGNATRAAASNKPTTQSVKISSSGQVTTSPARTAREAAGPITPKSDGRKLSRGNSLAKEKPVDFHAKEQLKEKAVAAHVRNKTYGASNSAKPKAGKDHRGYMPDGGRTTPRFNSTIKDKNGNLVKVSNTDNTILGKKEKFRQNLYSQIPDNVKGQARRTQQRQLDKQVTQYGKELERKARADAVAFQQSQEIKGFKGSTPKSQQAMAEHMAGIPKKPVAKPKPSSNKGIPANPPTHSPRGQAARVVQPNKKGGSTTTISSRSETRRGLREAGGNGDPVTNNGRSRTVDPKTGRPGLMANQGTRSSARPSPTRTRGSNPAENFPQRSGRARMTGDFKNPAGGSRVKTEAAKRFTPEEGSGLAARRKGRTSGIRPTDRRGSSTPIRRQGSATTDTKLKVTTKDKKTNKPKTRNVTRAGTSKPTTGTVSNQQAARATRNAQNFKPSSRNTPKASDNAPTRSQARQAALKDASDKIRENIRRTRGLTAKQKADKIREATKDLQERVGKPTGFDRRGEVKLQGSTKGNQYQTGIESGTPDGRVGKTGPHDGQVSRVVGKNSADKGRSTQAAQQTKDTLAKLRQRKANKAKAEAVLNNRSSKKLPGKKKAIKNGKPANTIKAKASQLRKGVRNAVDKKGNDLNYVMRQALKANGF